MLLARCLPLYPFVPVMRDTRPGRVLLSDQQAGSARLRERIIRDTRSRKDRETLTAAAYFVALRRFGKQLVESVFGGVAAMARTDMGQTLIRQGMEKGIALGKKLGEKRGVLRAKRETLLALLRAKFENVSATLVRKISGIEDSRRLDTLLRRILTANSLAEMGL